MRIWFFCCILFGFFPALADWQPSWHEGIIVLKDGQVQRGELSMHSFELALFKSENGVTVYTPHKVKSILYFDPGYNFYRKFVSIEVNNKRQAAFFEIVVSGKVGVVRKLKTPFVSCDNRSDKTDYKYYLMWDSEITNLRNFRHYYRRIVADYPHLNEDVKAKRLSPALEADAIRIIQLINTYQENPIIATR